MKKFFVFLCIGMLMCGISGSAWALSLYVDAAPNVYGSPDYDPWKASAFADAAAGTFVNMANSINPDNVGTTSFEIEDEVVYSFGDLGKRLTFIYWLPEVTITDIEGLFEISLTNVWDGEFLDFYDYYYGSTWLEPTTWENYDADGDGLTDGVIGLAGMAWWGAYGVNTPETLAADIAEWGMVSESWTFTAKLRGQEYSITATREANAPIPEPSTMLLLGSGLIGVFALARKKYMNK